MARIEINSDSFVSGSLTVDLEISDIFDDLTTAQIVEAILEASDVESIVSELDADEVLSAIGSDTIHEHVVNDSETYGEGLADALLDCDSDTAQNLRFYVLRKMLANMPRLIGDLNHLNDSYEMEQKAMLARALRPDVKPVEKIEWQEMESRKLTLAKLDALAEEIRLIKESIHADPDKA